ncbi:hypothetical protein ASG40_12285 [Methylobacterium sp. Leaf399]|uniref:hypothetical protein n=1 Tax=Methylobacterium sp. Leaf399 TaxID=1736364 RepID=UPI0006FA5E29|nr:hypothetical protein ASF39_12245 [Methylobacterium sp. Leaf108]KQT08642.1 hypothetical protein ASG40_12285 [Methylobacterium sp. Leaf399]KQT79020.1 hypothetical protein ASG59_05805 [Methylobacterium sp. Leaf466]
MRLTCRRSGRCGSILAVILTIAGPAPVRAEEPPGRNQGLPTPSITGGQLPLPSTQGETALSLTALLAGSDRALRSGLTWRIYEDRSDAGRPAIVARSTDADPRFSLAPGAYVATVTYGFASASRRIVVSGAAMTEQVRINAGALRLSGAIGDVRIAPADLAFSIFVPIGANSEGRLVRSAVKAGDLIRLPEGTYHVVSTYGESNAIQRADLKVDVGKVTDATLNHRAATVTLKLVAAPGAEAFAGTAFSVLTPGGDTIREAIGAFPAVTLAEGDYVLIARHDGQVYTREFKVESGLNRDIEVLAKAG